MPFIIREDLGGGFYEIFRKNRKVSKGEFCGKQRKDVFRRVWGFENMSLNSGREKYLNVNRLGTIVEKCNVLSMLLYQAHLCSCYSTYTIILNNKFNRVKNLIYEHKFA